MFKLALVASAAKSSRKGGDDYVLSFFVAIILVLIVILVGVFSPIALIVGGTKLLKGIEPQGVGVIGTLISYVASLIIIPTRISYKYEPWAPKNGYDLAAYLRYEKEYEKFKYKKALIIIATILIAIIVIALAASAVINIEKDPSAAGVPTIVLGVMALLLNAIAAITYFTLE